MKKIILLLSLLFAFCGIVNAAVNVNTATKEELDSLKGIGPAKAQAIIDYRTKNGPFSSVDDLEKVSGIGPKTMTEIRGDVSVSGANAAMSAKPSSPTPAPAAANKTIPAPVAKPVDTAKTPARQPLPPAAKATASMPAAITAPAKTPSVSTTAPTAKSADVMKTPIAPPAVAPSVKTSEPATVDGKKVEKKSSKAKEEKKADQPADEQVAGKKEKKSKKSDKADDSKKDKKDKKNKKDN